jgi:energy-coupling factor transport system permease protein
MAGKLIKQINLLDPRTKLILTGLYAVCAISVDRILWLTIYYGLLILIIALIGEIKTYTRWLRLVIPMSLFFGAVIWWSVDFNSAVFSALKLLVLTSIFFTFFTITAPEDMANSLVKIGLPYPVAFVMSTSLQFVPMMGRKVKDVLDAQRSRGIPLEPGWSALRHYPAFFGPILIQAFQFAEDLAEAMEARGFGRPGRTFLKEYKMGSRDWLAIAGGLIWLAIYTVVKYTR